MAYENSTDALRDSGVTITDSQVKIIILNGGLAYYFVEVTCRDGTRREIECTGGEGIELYKEVTHLKELPILVSS